MRKYLPSLFASFGVLLAIGIVFNVHAAAATHVVISEVQIGGSGAGDEFVELYNPTGVDVDLAGWRLRRTGGANQNLVASMSGTIRSRGFFLVANPEYDGTVTADEVYSASSSAITANSAVTLYSDAGLTIVDRVGMGSATDVETTAATAPAVDGSIERKANSSSTVDTMTGGADVLAGNSEETDNNANDFIVRLVSDPQNSESSLEPVTESPTPTPTATSTASPTATASPTGTASPTATPTASPTESPTPTASPTVSPTSTPVPTPTMTASPTATPTPFPFFNFSCKITYRAFRFRFWTILVPQISCGFGI